MIAALLKVLFKWSLELANKGKPICCFHANILLTQISLEHLDPDDTTTEFALIYGTFYIIIGTPNFNYLIHGTNEF